MSHPLDNPVWQALATNHIAQSIGNDLARRYEPGIAPFAGIPGTGQESVEALKNLAAPGERLCVLNVAPKWDDCWAIEKEILLHQMICDADLPSSTDSRIQELGLDDVPAMLELTALVYPAYFREGTATLGPYFGIFDGARLCSMAGIRMAMPGFREISAVCTHPDYRGQGFAKRLTTHLVSLIQAQGMVSFLHTEDTNEAAQTLYRGMGFSLREKLPFWILTRTA